MTLVHISTRPVLVTLPEAGGTAMTQLELSDWLALPTRPEP